jgi:hypothetical protein
LLELMILLASIISHTYYHQAFTYTHSLNTYVHYICTCIYTYILYIQISTEKIISFRGKSNFFAIIIIKSVDTASKGATPVN